jgi:DNA repair protein RadC
MNALYVSDGSGYTKAKDEDILMAAAVTIKKKMVKGIEFDLEKARKLLPPLLAGKTYEVFCVAFLDINKKLISFDEMFRGSIAETPVYVREVFKRALELNAVGLILVHNHPGGIAKASKNDIMVTMKCAVAASLFDMEVLDHFIVGETIESMRQMGAMDREAIMKAMMNDMGMEIKLIGKGDIKDLDEDHPIMELLKKLTKH